MIPAAFEYELAESPEHALELLGQHGDEAKLLAGGHSLLPLMKLRLARPSVLVDIGRLSDLRYVRDGGDHVAIGALSTHHDLETNDMIREQCGLVRHAASTIGDPQVRHRGTIGGSAAHGDPASDMPSVLVALGATLVVRGADGERTLEADDFFTSIFETALGPTDLLTEIRVPKLGGAGWSYQKFHQRAQDWATVGVAVVSRDGDGTRVALTTMGETPLRARGVEEALAGGASVNDAAARADEGTSPPSDTNGSAEYRRELVKVLVRRALEEAASRPGG